MRIKKKTKIGFKYACAAIFGLITVITGAPVPELINNDADVPQLLSEPDNSDLTRLVPDTNEQSEDAMKNWFFGYGQTNGPNYWTYRYRECGGVRQSPINLDTTTSKTSHHPRLFWWNYNLKPKSMTVKNNGHTVVLRGSWLDPENVPYYWHSNGNENEAYYAFDQLHFHWGPNNSVGSEHTINNQRYPLEMHVVHYKRTFTDVKQALSQTDGLRVVALLFKLSEHENVALRPIISVLKDIQHEDEIKEIEPFEIRKLLPEFSSSFLTYNGSLTAPPCSETVNWVVRTIPSTISSEQMEEFRKLKSDHGEPLTYNYRPVQSLNGRVVFHVR